MAMLLTKCAACDETLAHDAPHCARCRTRYCNATCQHDHWRRGHKQICKRIHRGGNAEQYYADKKYKEAVAVAVEACADDTKGQTCYICTQALHWKTKEGLVRGCSCRGTAGFAHVSCLAEQAKILVAEAEENNLSIKVQNERWHRWSHCSLCEQKYHGVVWCALGWACWKTYVGRPEGDTLRRGAIEMLGHGLSAADNHVEALSVQEAELSMLRRLGTIPGKMLAMQSNLAMTYGALGRHEQAVCMRRELYSEILKLYGKQHEHTVVAASNFAATLIHLRVRRFEEARSLLCKTIPVARRLLGENHSLMFTMKKDSARALYQDTGATLDELREAVTTLEDTERTARRVLGGAHPDVVGIEESLRWARKVLRAREAGKDVIYIHGRMGIEI